MKLLSVTRNDSVIVHCQSFITSNRLIQAALNSPRDFFPIYSLHPCNSHPSLSVNIPVDHKRESLVLTDPEPAACRWRTRHCFHMGEGGSAFNPPSPTELLMLSPSVSPCYMHSFPPLGRLYCPLLLILASHPLRSVLSLPACIFLLSAAPLSHP